MLIVGQKSSFLGPPFLKLQNRNDINTMPSNFDIYICYFFCYSSQQFDEEDEDETDGKPNPAAAAKAALGMILVQFKYLRKFVIELWPICQL